MILDAHRRQRLSPAPIRRSLRPISNLFDKVKVDDASKLKDAFSALTLHYCLILKCDVDSSFNAVNEDTAVRLPDDIHFE